MNLKIHFPAHVSIILAKVRLTGQLHTCKRKPQDSYFFIICSITLAGCIIHSVVPPLTHTLTQMAISTGMTVGSHLGFSFFPKDTLTCGHEEQGTANANSNTATAIAGRGSLQRKKKTGQEVTNRQRQHCSCTPSDGVLILFRFWLILSLGDMI